jgi:hypothetical protein
MSQVFRSEDHGLLGSCVCCNNACPRKSWQIVAAQRAMNGHCQRSFGGGAMFLTTCPFVLPMRRASESDLSSVLPAFDSNSLSDPVLLSELEARHSGQKRKAPGPAHDKMAVQCRYAAHDEESER